MFHYDGTIHKRLFAYDNANDADYGRGHVISNGTFSKILAPGLRLGWMEMPTKLRESFFKTRWVTVLVKNVFTILYMLLKYTFTLENM